MMNSLYKKINNQNFNKMYKNLVQIAIAAIFTSVMMMGCGGSKQVASPLAKSSSSPFRGGTEAPCTVYDDDEYFAATGIASGPATQKGTLQRSALSNGQSIVRQKLQHAYEGVVKDYFESVGANKGTDVENQVVGGGTQVIMGIVNNTSHSCLMWSDVDEKGNMECYIGIKVSKAKVANAVADNLSKSEKQEIREHAETFRKQISEDLKKYKEE
jgi:hypothetical protein